MSYRGSQHFGIGEGDGHGGTTSPVGINQSSSTLERLRVQAGAVGYEKCTRQLLLSDSPPCDTRVTRDAYDCRGPYGLPRWPIPGPDNHDSIACSQRTPGRPSWRRPDCDSDGVVLMRGDDHGFSAATAARCIHRRYAGQRELAGWWVSSVERHPPRCRQLHFDGTVDHMGERRPDNRDGFHVWPRDGSCCRRTGSCSCDVRIQEWDSGDHREGRLDWDDHGGGRSCWDSHRSGHGDLLARRDLRVPRRSSSRLSRGYPPIHHAVAWGSAPDPSCHRRQCGLSAGRERSGIDPNQQDLKGGSDRIREGTV